MANPWQADWEVSQTIVETIIAEQFPQLAPIVVKEFSAGWDNTVFLVNEQFIFRFPRRRDGVALISTEITALPFIAPLLPLPISAPQFAGKPSHAFPYAFAGYPKMVGQTGELASLSDEARLGLAVPLAEFLKTLHSIDVDAARHQGARPNLTPKANVKQRITKAKERFSAITDQTLKQRLASLHTFLMATDASQTGRMTIIHGDFHARHLIINQGRVNGIIDWGDVQIADPAVDLAIMYLFLPSAGRAAFESAYGEIDAATKQLALVHAVCDTISLLAYAYDAGLVKLYQEALFGLGNIKRELARNR